MGNRRGGILNVKVDGEIVDVKGNWTYNFGIPKRDALVGADRIHGYKEVPQVPFVEGEITDREGLDVKAFQNLTDTTVTLELANGKTGVWRNAWYASEGNVQTEEGNIAIRFEALEAEEI